MGVIGQYKSPRYHSLTDEEDKLIIEYAVALDQLARGHHRYDANVKAWNCWNNAQRLAWIYWLEEQAEKEKPLPLAQALVTRVLTNKLTS